MAFDRAGFAEFCVDCTISVGVWPPHLLIAMAQARSGLSTDTVDGRVGPFRFSVQVWDANRSDAEYGIDYKPEHIKLWAPQCVVAAIMTRRAITRLQKAKTGITLESVYGEVFPPAAGAAAPNLQAALAQTKDLVAPAIRAVLGSTYVGQEIPVDLHGTPVVNYAKTIALKAHLAMGTLILDAFIDAGYRPHHAVAALANAIGESRLQPDVHNPNGEDSWGLFQCNRNGGLGAGHSVAELCDPKRNISLILDATEKVPEFLLSTTIEEAVATFVRFVERPKNPAADIARRIQIAYALLS